MKSKRVLIPLALAGIVAVLLLIVSLNADRTQPTLPDAGAGNAVAVSEEPGRQSGPAVPPEVERGGERGSGDSPAAPAAPVPAGVAGSGAAAVWEVEGAEPVFGAFAQWANRYLEADAAARGVMEAEGVRLATARQGAMFALIETDPRRAIELSIPAGVRGGLPASVQALTEAEVSGRGDLEVLCVLLDPEDAAAGGGQPGFLRSVELNGHRYEAFVYGARAEAITKRDLPLNGVVLDGRMAVNENPFRPLGVEEMARLDASMTSTCAAGHVLGRGEGVGVDLGGEVQVWCRHHLAMSTGEHQLAALDPDALSGPVSEAGRTYTEGRKKLIIFRVAFSNVATPQLSETRARELITNSHDFWKENSYGRLTIAMPGEGSDVIVVTLAGASTDYDDDAGALRSDTRAAAAALGYNLADYDFDITATGNTPAFSWAGLGYVGAPGSWIRSGGNFSTGVTVHELGHNLGFPHGNYWDTGGESTLGPGGNQEYGDSFDVMGGGPTPNGHYCGKFKWRAGWLTDLDYPRVTTSGRHRIYAHDHQQSLGVRGLRVAHDSALDFSLTFRQQIGNAWFQDGLLLHWGSPGGSSSQLLDTTPGSPGNKNDSPVVIGRTFHDAEADLYLTPVGKGNTFPQSLDVQVNFGPFPGNLAPELSLAADSATVAVGTPLRLRAAASDANGDELAYYWQFGDDQFGANAPEVLYSWGGAGEYRVQCTVSDMKGGTRTDSIVITVGSPSTFSISGHVLDDNQPVEGVLVRASSSRYAYTDSDGRYEITRLTAGSYNLTATLYPLTFSNPFFSNPVTVGPDAVDRDFITVDASIDGTVLVDFGSVWRYRDDGSDQGTLWRGEGFNDSGWASGPAELGYGDDDEATVVGFGPDSNDKYATTYFRHQFNVEDPTLLTNVMLRLLRDDGGLVYLNGVEVARDTMPSGTVTYTTYATDNSEDTTSRLLPHGLLHAGMNTLAVEIHQVDGSSSDISFDLQLTATTVTNFVGLSAIYVARPEQNQVFTTPALVPLQVNAFGGVHTNVEFLVDGGVVAEVSGPPFIHVLASPPIGEYALTFRARDVNGGVTVLGPVNISVREPVVVTPPMMVNYIPAGAVWKYLDNGSDQGTAWRQRGFNDAGWASGAAQLGYGDNDESTVISFGGVGSNKHITSYFRRTFDVADPAAVASLGLQIVRDDGAVVYLNGVEIFRSNLPSGAIDHLTLAPSAVSGGDEDAFFAGGTDASLLVAGDNVIAVEIHQNAPNSSDLSFDFILNANLITPERGVVITQPADGALLLAPASAPVVAIATPGAGLGIMRVEFSTNGVLMVTDATQPYGFDWNGIPIGTHVLTAEAFESGGQILVSDPVTITVQAPPGREQLIARGSAWKYLAGETYPGTGWVAPAFGDSAWRVGEARLGYGGDGEVTTVDFGPDADSKYITTYFRRAFNVANPAAYDGLSLLLSRDDGAVVYLNGAEVHRSNMLPGRVSPNSLAVIGVGGSDETNFESVTLGAGGLLAGNNVIAVEVHQQSINSSDLGFDLELEGLIDVSLVEGIYITAPAGQSVYDQPVNVTLESYAISASGVSLVEYFEGESKIGESGVAPYPVVWNNPAIGAHSVIARVHYGGGGTADSVPVTFTVEGAGVPVAATRVVLVPQGSIWRYEDSGVDLGGVWKERFSTDAAWGVGPAGLGYGLEGERTTVAEGSITVYYRHWFTANNPELLDALFLQIRRDDGAVVYLNGNEILRTGLPAGPISHGTLATTAMNGLDEQYFFEGWVSTAGSGLVAGSNLLAVAVHQASADSSDSGFDIEVTGVGTSDRRAYLASPGSNSILPPDSDIRLEAQAHAGQGAVVTKVEFFVDGGKVGEAASAPYVHVWPGPPAGNYAVHVVATDNNGATIISDPVNVATGLEPVEVQLIAPGAVWRYLDNGSDQGTAWRGTGFNDSSWAMGPAQLGYGDGDEATVVGFGPSSGNKYPTTYFRRGFVVPAGVSVNGLTVRLQRDDGGVVYLNGVEVFRSNMPGGAINYLTLAGNDTGSETEFHAGFADAGLLVDGLNVVAVEIHQGSAGSSDLSMDLELLGAGFREEVPPPGLTVSPAVNRRVTVRWPASAVGWTLYGSTSLDPGAIWTVIPNMPSVVDGTNTVVILATTPQRYFRLQQ